MTEHERRRLEGAPLAAVRGDAREEQPLQQRAAGPGLLADQVEQDVAIGGRSRRGTARAARASSFITGSPNVSATSIGVNVSALGSSPLSSTGISITIPRNRSGAAEAISSAVLAPSEVPITTACSISRWSISATTCAAKKAIEYRHMSPGRSDSPWPSRSTVITRFPRAARSSASGQCICWDSSRPWMRISGRVLAGVLLAVRPRTPVAVMAAGPPPNSV